MTEDFKLVLINGANCSPEFIPSYREVYSHWKKIWQTTFQELDGQSEIDSDNFSRQDEILALFHKDRCIAVACHRYADLLLPSLMDDTYFSSWPEEIKTKIQQMQGRIAIGNQISIDPAFRKLPDGTAMKDVLLWFSLNHLKAQEINFVLGAVREDKSLDKLFAKYGAQILKQNVHLHNVPVTLVCFQRDEIALQPQGLPISWLSKIYQNRKEDPYTHFKFLTPDKRRAS